MALPTVAEQDVLNVVLTQTSAGACLRGSDGRTGRLVSLKLLPLRSSSESQWSERFLQDVSRVRRACSDRVLVPLGLYRAQCLVGLVSEWMPGASLHSLLYETQLDQAFPVPLRLRILLDVAEGLSHLHTFPVSHQALKSTNVLLDKQYRAKVCDFGQWTGQSTVSALYERGRNLWHLSPEVLQGEIPSTKADMYSFGILLWETLNRRAPYEKVHHPRELLVSVQSGVRSGAGGQTLLPEMHHGHTLAQLVVRCWSSDPRSRPTAVDCMLELRKALATFDPESPAQAALQLKECKERALLGCKAQPTGEMKMEMNNMELYSGCRGSKNTGMKTVPMDPVQATTPVSPTARSNSTLPYDPSPPTQGRSSPTTLDSVPSMNLKVLTSTTSNVAPTWEMHDSHSEPELTELNGECATLPLSMPGTLCSHTDRLPQPRTGAGGMWQRQSSSTLSPPSPSLSPPASGSSAALDPLKPSPVGLSGPSCQGIPFGSLAGQSCCRMLRERREVIVRSMTEGRLNNLLDVLRARRALNREAYELITAALTLAARTRSLLDTCLCLGEGAASLVASTLGLVSVVTTHSPCHVSN